MGLATPSAEYERIVAGSFHSGGSRTWIPLRSGLTWMMNRKMGFFGSYWLGLDPSRTPPWGVARRVADGEAEDEATTLVTVVVTTDAIDDAMMKEGNTGGSRAHWSRRLPW